MQRRNFVRNIAALTAVMGMDPMQAMARFFQQPPYKIQMLTENTGIFTERGGTILFTVTRDGIVIVDSQYPDQGRHFVEAMQQQQQGKPFALLINTHHHADHSGGNIAFKGLVQHVLAHANSKANQQRVAAERKTEDQQLYPDQTYTDTWCQKIGKETICLHYFGAAHTNGDSLVLLERSNIAHMGDLVFNRIYPNIDRPAGASITNWMKVLEASHKKLDRKTKVICGHALQPEGLITNRDTLLEMRDYLGVLLDFTGKEIRAGKTKDELLQNTVIPGADTFKDQYKFIKVNLGTAYDELTAAK